MRCRVQICSTWVAGADSNEEHEIALPPVRTSAFVEQTWNPKWPTKTTALDPGPCIVLLPADHEGFKVWAFEGLEVQTFENSSFWSS